MTIDKNLIVKKIKQRRKELNYSYQDLADRTKMSKSTLQRYETGSIKNIPLDKLEVLSKALKISPIQLIGIEEKNHYNTVNEASTTYSIFTKEEEKLIYNYRKLSKEAKDIVDYIVNGNNNSS